MTNPDPNLPAPNLELTQMISRLLHQRDACADVLRQIVHEIDSGFVDPKRKERIPWYQAAKRALEEIK